MPGIICFLHEAIEANVEQALSLTLWNDALKWLWGRQGPPSAPSRFGYSCVPGLRQNLNSRMAWCYGDLGIYSLLERMIGHKGRTPWRAFLDSLADRCLAWPLERTGIEDCSLCHGAFGASHIFNRLYQHTRDPRFREAAFIWMERGIKMSTTPSGPKSSFSGHQIITRSRSRVRGDHSFLTGSVGIGLALLSASSYHEPRWDGILLLSKP
jgi:hypothetical protein